MMLESRALGYVSGYKYVKLVRMCVYVCVCMCVRR